MGQTKKLCYDPLCGLVAAREILAAKIRNRWTLQEMSTMTGGHADSVSRVLVFGKAKESDLVQHMHTRSSGYTVTTIWSFAALVTDPSTGQPYEPMKYYLKCWCGLTNEEIATYMD